MASPISIDEILRTRAAGSSLLPCGRYMFQYTINYISSNVRSWHTMGLTTFFTFSVVVSLFGIFYPVLGCVCRLRWRLFSVLIARSAFFCDLWTEANRLNGTLFGIEFSLMTNVCDWAPVTLYCLCICRISFSILLHNNLISRIRRESSIFGTADIDHITYTYLYSRVKLFS